jgi:hypothetical protein
VGITIRIITITMIKAIGMTITIEIRMNIGIRISVV